ncbi:SAM-dependent chlorinase/fluorinase [Panacibacter ginsenosidivorans]|uniref:SAM-dependent chlorinase/fluorinase n=1 Tax=Panacibacter ginsenosidivorans TaxID=1813871 RepID=A0A5B8V970_9BACT|nr:SAM-dependent chlorinase/fluorinase [Panacibacter ginsenosidivorans]QEC67266.1 SAM-dependent chlorinase/fluorinase [Panacibacter ginsenosidivorans]
MPVITFSSDIGLNDYLVGAIKGQLISAIPDCTIADISHQLSPYDYQQAAYVCGNAFKYFPADTFHLIMVNFFEKPLKYLLLAEYGDQYIICPDNGMLTMITRTRPENINAIDIGDAVSLLDCTKVIAACIHKMITGAKLTNVSSITEIDEKYPMRSAVGNDWIDSQIIYIDNFENVVLNLTKEEFEEIRRNRKFKIVLMRNSEFITKISDHYASVQPGENLAFFNAAGYLEIAINKGNVAGLFGLQKYANTSNMQNRLLYQTVRITFE